VRFRTGVTQLDCQIHGGLPAGIVELFGEAGSGKTALALSVAREAHLKGLPCALIHMQGGAPDTMHVRMAGCADIAVSVPTFGEAALETASSCLWSGFRVIILDSLTNVRPRSEDSLPVGEREPQAARLIYHGLSVLKELAYSADSILICTNEVRARLDRRGVQSAYERVMPALTDMRLRLDRSELHTEYGELDYVKSKVRIVQANLSRVGIEAEFYTFGVRGLDRDHELLRELIATNLYCRVGAYWEGPLGRLGPGFDRATIQVAAQHNQLQELLDE